MSATLPFTTGDRSADGIETVSRCLFCNSDSSSQTFDGVRDLFFKADDGKFTYRRCNACQSLWLETRPSGDRLLRAYSTYHTHAEPQPDATRKGLRGIVRALYIRSRFAQSSGIGDGLLIKSARAILPDNAGIDLQYRYAPRSPARLLDYGCGNAEYLLRMKPLGYALAGVEYDPHLLTAVARQGIQIEDVVTVDRQPWMNAFDHITLAHVLEHVTDPRGLIARLFAFLKPGGTLFIELPNADATGLQIFGRYWRGFEAPRHFALPTRAALTGALQQAGFVIERQHVDHGVRRWMWEESLSVCPLPDRAGFEAEMGSAPPETQTNAEFLTFLVRKPS